MVYDIIAEIYDELMSHIDYDNWAGFFIKVPGTYNSYI